KTNPMIALAEGYMDKDIEVDGDLEYIMESIFSQQRSFINKHKHKHVHSRKKYKNTKIIAKENASFNYDLDNDFKSLLLDKTMNYSCAYFKTKADSLYTAQVNKTNHILKKLNLQSGQSLLDIGSGWGHLIIEAAKQYNVQTLG